MPVRAKIILGLQKAAHALIVLGLASATLWPTAPAHTPPPIAAAPRSTCPAAPLRRGRILVGRAPLDIVADARTGRAFVKNADGTVSVLDTRRATLLRTVRTEDGGTYQDGWLYPVRPLAVDEAAGRVLVANPRGNAAARQGSLSLLDARSGRVLRTLLTGRRPVGVVVDSRRGHAFVANYDDGSVSLVDVRRGVVLRTTRVGGAPAGMTVDSQRGDVVVGNNTRAGVAVLDAATGALRRTLPVAANAVAVDSQTGHVFAAAVLQPGTGAPPLASSVVPPGAISDTVLMMDPERGTILRLTHLHSPSRPYPYPGYGVGVVVDAATVRVFANYGDLVLLNADSGAIAARVIRLGPVAEEVDAATGRAFVTDWGLLNYMGELQGTGSVHVVDATNGALLATVGVGVAPAAVAVDAQADRALVLSSSPNFGPPNRGSVDLLDATAGGLTLAQRRNPTLRVAPACPPALYVSQSGHNLAGPFLAFWRQHGGVAVLGNPRTDAFSDHGTRVQYTDRVLLRRVGGQVQPAPLGRELTKGRTFARVAPFASTPNRRYFPATGHSLSGGFLRYWQRHDGARLLGAPLSEVIVEGNGDGSGRRYPLQWFENGRLEYHAELAGTPYVWELGLLGVQALHQRGWLPAS